jgi:hypothetical protein
MVAVVADWAAASAEGQEWVTIPPIRQSGLPGLLGELEDRMPAQHIYRDDDRITWAHETTHGLNSRIRNQHGSGVNAVYLYGCGAVVLKEPPVTIAQVAAAVNDRGRLFDLYLVKQRQDWNNQPLYIVDEMVSYLNGAIVGHEWGACGVVYEHENAVEMYKYAVVLYELVAARHPEYDRQAFRALLDRTHEYLEVLTPYGVAAKESNEVACVKGGQSSGLFGRAGFRRRMPTFPCRSPHTVVAEVPAGLPPRRPDPPGPSPILPSPGPPAEPPLDPPLVPIPDSQIDHDNNLAKINKRLDELEKAIAERPAGAECEVTLKMFDSLTTSVEALTVYGRDEVAKTNKALGELREHEHAGAGKPGEFSEAALDALADKVLAKLPPLRFQAKFPDGTPNGPPIDKHLGDTVGIRNEDPRTPEQQAGPVSVE